MNGKASEKDQPVAPERETLLDDPGNEDPGSQLDAPVPLLPSTKTSTEAQRQKGPRPDADKPH